MKMSIAIRLLYFTPRCGTVPQACHAAKEILESIKEGHIPSSSKWFTSGESVRDFCLVCPVVTGSLE